MLRYLGPGSYQGYNAPNLNSATGLNNIINQLRQRPQQQQQQQQHQQPAINPGNNRPHPPRHNAFINQAPPTTVQTYTPRPGPVAKPIAQPVTTPAQVGTPSQGPIATPIGAPVQPVNNPLLASQQNPPPVVPATGPYGPVAGVPLQRLYG